MKRFAVGGIDRDGTGAVYSFDPVGSYERESCRAAGAAQSLIQPFLDNMVYSKNQVRDPQLPALEKGKRPELPLERVIGLVTDAFTGATERHIEVGDGLEMFVIEKGKGVRLISKGAFGFSITLACTGACDRARQHWEMELTILLWNPQL